MRTQLYSSLDGARLRAQSHHHRKPLLLFIFLLFALALFSLGDGSDNGEPNNAKVDKQDFIVVDEDSEVYSPEGGEEDDNDDTKEVVGKPMFYTTQCSPKPDSLVLQAVCGLGYAFPKATVSEKVWTVLFLGGGFNKGRAHALMGCPESRTCPKFPKCEFEYANTASTSQIKSANVVLVHQDDAKVMIPKVTAMRQSGNTSVVGLYWREAHKTYVPMDLQMQTEFEMGVHFNAKIVSPLFALLPGVLRHTKHNMDNFSTRDFAMYVTSDCHTLSKRSTYLKHLVTAVKSMGEARKFNLYGNCFNNPLPGVTIQSFKALMARHKFYLAFENTIQDGYVTEKLFFPLSQDVIPVYFGALDAPNITTTRSYIKASDFPTPELLAEYLVYLDNHPEKYHEYFAWKLRDEDVFETAYLKTLAKQWIGARERAETREVKKHFADRTAACCRLCNREFMLQSTSNRQLVPKYLTSAQLQQRFYNNSPVEWLP
ncbi:hypothetical protein BASA81_000271 [Batrachochytrium salamandrivorans]|nr:hypothetical protein BASA81_000271 [Batrachochytrium salamandrivorans]